MSTPMRRGVCCARAASGQAVAEPAITLMNSRRCMCRRLPQLLKPSTLRWGGKRERQNNRPRTLRPDVRLGSIAEVSASLDHLIRGGKQRRRHSKTDRLGGLEVDD